MIDGGGEKQKMDRMTALMEVINIGARRGAKTVNQMGSAHVRLNIPMIEDFSRNPFGEIMKELRSDSCSGIEFQIKGSFCDTAIWIFPRLGASQLVATLLGSLEAGQDLDSIEVGALTEVSNLTMSSILDSIGNVLDQKIEYTTALYHNGNIDPLTYFNLDEAERVYLDVKADFVVEAHLIKTDLIFLFRDGAFKFLLEAMDRVVSRLKR